MIIMGFSESWDLKDMILMGFSESLFLGLELWKCNQSKGKSRVNMGKPQKRKELSVAIAFCFIDWPYQQSHPSTQ